MRTTVDLPDDVHERAKRLAAERRQSLSATVAELTVRGLASLSEPATISVDPVTGLPVLSLGRRVTDQDVADALDDE
jgi:predicted transcriptional regulator